MTERKKKGASPAERPRGRGVRAVAEMVPEIGGAAFRRFGFVQSAVVSRWGEIVGPRYAGVCAPESIRFPAGKRQDGVLHLVVESGHAPMLQHVGPAIVERVNRFFGYPAVARIAMRAGHLARPVPRPAPASLRPIPQDMRESVRDVADPELRACLEALAGAVAAATVVPVLGTVR